MWNTQACSNRQAGYGLHGWASDLCARFAALFSHISSDSDAVPVTHQSADRIWLGGGRGALGSADSLPRTHAGMSTSASRRHRLCAAALTGVAITTTVTALLPQLASARPWPIPQSRWSNSVQDYPEPSAPPRPWWNSQAKDGYQSYDRPPLTPEQQAQRCNTGRLIGGLGGGAVAYAMSRDDGRAWAIPLGALLGSQVGCNTAAGRGPLPW